MGSGGLVVMDENTCMVEVARFFMSFTQRESCGKCVPCREGTKRMLEILEKIVAGKGEMKDLDELEELANMVQSMALCRRLVRCCMARIIIRSNGRMTPILLIKTLP